MAKKLQSALAVEEELPEDGLAAYGDNLMVALARKMVSAEDEDTETMEEVFVQARDAEASADELLVDDGWKALEPVVVGVHANGANSIGPTVELYPVNGRYSNGDGKGNGHHNDEDAEPQQSLLSRAEFMAEEPVKPKGRSRKPQHTILSMFEWALSMEQDGKVDLVGGEP